MGLTVRFVVSSDNKKGEYTIAVDYLLQCAIFTDTGKLLHDWYEHMDIEKFKIKYPLKQSLNVDEILRRNEQWTTQANIEYTSAVFVNGYPISKPYLAKELPDYTGSLEDTFSSMQAYSEQTVLLI